MKAFRTLTLLWCMWVFGVMFFSCKPSLATYDTDPRISLITEAMEYHKEVSKKVQMTGTMLWTRAWPLHRNGRVIQDVPLSTREKDFSVARSGERFRYDATETFPGESHSTTMKVILEPGKLIEAFALEVANPTVSIAEVDTRSIYTPIKLLLTSHYSFLNQPLSRERLQSENYTYELIREEVYNGSKCFVLHGEITKAGLKKWGPLLPPGTNVTLDVWFDTQKDLAIVQSKYRIENLNYTETVIELGEYGGFWFPKKVREKEYDLRGGKDKLIEDVSLEAHEVTIGQRVAPSLFTLDGLSLPPRTRVVDKINGIEFVLEKRGK